jgi:2-oxoglutarate dehydrogenase E2 component (dihydrolipoamide succinyltransferase)
MLCELETDKVSVEVPAPASGHAEPEILADEGGTVEAGGKLARHRWQRPAGASPPEAPAEAKPGPSAARAEEPAARCRGRAFGGKGDGRGRARPAIRSGHRPRRPHHEGGRRARRGWPCGIPRPGGPACEPAPAPAPRAPVPAEDAGREERVKMTRLRQNHRAAPEGRAEHRRDADHL